MPPTVQHYSIKPLTDADRLHAAHAVGADLIAENYRLRAEVRRLQREINRMSTTIEQLEGERGLGH